MKLVVIYVKAAVNRCSLCHVSDTNHSVREKSPNELYVSKDHLL